MLGSLGAGVVGLIVCMLVSQPWVGLGLCIGLAVGISNFRLIQRSVVKVGQRVDQNKRRPLAMNTLGRMGVVTVIALGLLFLLPPLGFGLLGGLALFQFILLGNVTRSMLKMGAGAIPSDEAGDTGDDAYGDSGAGSLGSGAIDDEWGAA